MLKKNVSIKVGESFLELDDQTALGLTMEAYHIEAPENIFLSKSNNFTVPITAGNRLILGFAEQTYSNSQLPYKMLPASIYIDGALIMRGEIYITSISDRYNVVFIEAKELFDKLQKLPFIALQSDEYPNSLCNLVAAYWNEVIIGQINNQYGIPSDSTAQLNNIMRWCNEVDYAGYPVHSFAIPIVQNELAYKVPRWNNDGHYEVSTNNNDLYNSKGNSEDHNDIPQGFVLSYGMASGKPVPEGDRTTWAHIGRDHADELRFGEVLISPLWASVDVFIEILENYTGWKFNGLREAILSRNNGMKLFCRLNGIEFNHSFEVTVNRGIEHFAWMNKQIFFDGTVSPIKGNMDWYGYKFVNGNAVENLNDDDLCKQTALDFLKTLVQDNNLIVSIDSSKKEVIFDKFEKLNESPYTFNAVLASQNTKYFNMDGIKQKQAITYTSGNDSNSNYSKRIITCENDTIEAGSENDVLVNIERYMWGASDHIHSGGRTYTFFSKNIAILDNESNKGGMCFGFPIYGEGDNSLATDKFKAVSMGFSVQSNETDPAFDTYPLYTNISIFADSGIFLNKRYINCLIQPSVATTSAYDYYQEFIRKPVVLDVTLLNDDPTIVRHFKAVNSVHIDGLAGNYYLQSISSYNPRLTTGTYNATVCKLPGISEPVYLIKGTAFPNVSAITLHLNRTSASSGGVDVTVQVDKYGNWYWNNEEGINITSLAGMLYNNRDITSISFSNRFDTSEITNMYGMFYGCSELKSINVSNLNTESATSLQAMFSRCLKLEEIDISDWDTSSVTNMNNAFSYCYALKKLYMNNCDLSNVTTFSQIFDFTEDLEQVFLKENTISANFDISPSDKLSIDSIKNICIALKEVATAKTLTISTEQQTLINANRKLILYIEIAKLKNWNTSLAINDLSPISQLYDAGTMNATAAWITTRYYSVIDDIIQEQGVVISRTHAVPTITDRRARICFFSEDGSELAYAYREGLEQCNQWYFRPYFITKYGVIYGSQITRTVPLMGGSSESVLVSNTKRSDMWLETAVDGIQGAIEVRYAVNIQPYSTYTGNTANKRSVIELWDGLQGSSGAKLLGTWQASSTLDADGNRYWLARGSWQTAKQNTQRLYLKIYQTGTAATPNVLWYVSGDSFYLQETEGKKHLFRFYTTQ